MLLDWQSGKELCAFPTETNYSSSITVEPRPGGAIWVASTLPPIELLRYSRKITRRLDTPGTGDKTASTSAPGVSPSGGRLRRRGR